MMSIWLIRTFTRVIDACVKETLVSTLKIAQEGISTWVADQYEVFSLDEYVGEVSSFVTGRTWFFGDTIARYTLCTLQPLPLCSSVVSLQRNLQHWNISCIHLCQDT